MKRHILAFFSIGILTVGAGILGAGSDEAIKKDRLAIAGTWRVISYTKDGKKTPEEFLEKTRSIYSADGKARVEREGKLIVEATTKIDPSKKPKPSDATYTEGEL